MWQAAAALELAASRGLMVWMIPSGVFCDVAGLLVHCAARLFEGKLQWTFNAALSRVYVEPEHVGWPGAPHKHTTTNTCKQ